MGWFAANLGLVAELVVQHARLSVVPIVLGLVLALPPGVLAWRRRRLRGPLLAAVGLLYTIPSLALFVLVPPVVGISFLSELNVVIALTVYAVALMVRFVTDALDAVDPAVRSAATAMGYSPWGRFWAVDLPLAGPVLLAGLRVVAVSTVSLVTVGVLVGTRSLGYLFMDGLQRGIVAEIVTGILATVLVALVFDVLLVLLGRVLLPWNRRPSRAGRRLQLTAGGAG
ncbi:ABC transporter permease subunit [Georgenia satyanarayanai]|uniref:ABC transporter permease n=1 Tax=Georgenia satyanarayanai TaxID=860221 RepID=UPI00203FA6A3|nr:ABC transporter permease subunit [Georgenia satyanarayanai]MCM3662221.1 ABC transporter permease subunit [Georgenia satyanarayanai]